MKIEDIYEAQNNIYQYLHPSPIVFSQVLRREINKSVWLKLETQLPTGSFKPRPAFNSILKQLDEAKLKGVVASSSGNFAQAVAYAAQQLGIAAVIVMTENTLPYKIERTRQLGAEVVLCANTYEARNETTENIQKETGRVLLHPYNSKATIAGDGTIALECLQHLGREFSSDMTVIVPVSGGGLLAGIAFTLKHLQPNCKVIGVQPKKNGSLFASWQKGHCVNVGPVQTVADALVASSPGDYSFSLIKQYVDDVIEVEEEDIIAATKFFLEQHKLVVEPAGSVPLAALLQDKIPGNKFLYVVSGGNINLKNNL